jgi:small ligand-binding sensory domain FIST
MGSTAVRNNVTTQSLPAKQRSRVSNGTKLFAAAVADGRSAWARRYRDLLSTHISDAGGEAVVTGAEIAIIRRATRIEVEMEMADAAAAAKGTAASAEELYLYCTGSNSMRRLFESVGLKRVVRDVTPTLSQYLMQRAPDEAEPESET